MRKWLFWMPLLLVGSLLYWTTALSMGSVSLWFLWPAPEGTIRDIYQPLTVSIPDSPPNFEAQEVGFESPVADPVPPTAGPAQGPGHTAF